jgi:hypothetical protein
LVLFALSGARVHRAPRQQVDDADHSHGKV